MQGDKIPVIIFLEAPGAGKGTQALQLAKIRSIPKISTGDVLRHAVMDETELGAKVKAIMAEGKLVDDETMLNIVRERIKKPDCANGFILDGYPRNIHQAAQLEQILDDHMELCVFDIEVSEDEIVRRVAGRRTCPVCNRIYNIYFHTAAKPGICDYDGETLFQRTDDTEEVVRKRIATYIKETLPLVDHYQKKGVLQVINGDLNEAAVTQQIAGHMAC